MLGFRLRCGIEQVMRRIGKEAYGDLQQTIIGHQEVFNQQIYELHRLTRQQRHLEAPIKDGAPYQAELARLAAQQQLYARPLGAPQLPDSRQAANESGDLEVQVPRSIPRSPLLMPRPPACTASLTLEHRILLSHVGRSAELPRCGG